MHLKIRKYPHQVLRTQKMGQMPSKVLHTFCFFESDSSRYSGGEPLAELLSKYVDWSSAEFRPSRPWGPLKHSTAKHVAGSVERFIKNGEMLPCFNKEAIGQSISFESVTKLVERLTAAGSTAKYISDEVNTPESKANLRNSHFISR